MVANTKIEWAHHTFNPWIGCTKVSPACDHCYAEADFATRRKVVQWGAGQPRKLTADSTWAMPRRWNAEAERLGVRYRVFCASLADVFDNEVSVQWRRNLFDLIKATPHLDWLLLTKRIGNARNLYAEAYLDSARAWPANVWIGASITSQAEADRDIPKLLAVPAAKRFLSMEPLLGPVDLERPRPGPDLDQGGGRTICQPWLIQSGIDWIIVGGESGPHARPMHPDWARSLRDQCQAAGVPFLFKQWGEWCPRGPESLGYPSVDGVPRFRMTDAGHNGQDLDSDGDNDVWMNRAGKKAAGRQLDGRTWDEVPA
jgi:protein gp37